MPDTPEIIKSTVNGAVVLSGTGADGFILFAIVIVALMFGFMGFISYKSIKTLMGSHTENAERIEEAHTRIHDLEHRENDCIKRLDIATTRLEGCIDTLKEVKHAE